MQPCGEESALAHTNHRRLLISTERNIMGFAPDASHKSATDA